MGNLLPLPEIKYESLSETKINIQPSKLIILLQEYLSNYFYKDLIPVIIDYINLREIELLTYTFEYQYKYNISNFIVNKNKLCCIKKSYETLVNLHVIGGDNILIHKVFDVDNNKYFDIVCIKNNILISHINNQFDVVDLFCYINPQKYDVRFKQMCSVIKHYPTMMFLL